MKRWLLLAVFLVPALFTNLEAQVPRVVALFQHTGSWCQWCPYGTDSVEAVLGRNPNVRALAFHNNYNATTTDPMSTAELEAEADSFLVNSWPTAVVDRVVWLVGSTYVFALSRSLWGAACDMRLANAPTSPLAINVAGTFDPATRTLSGTATLNVSQAMQGNFWVHILISEDSLNYQQLKNVNSTVITLYPYYHKRVVRRFVTGINGIQLTPTGLAASQVVNQPFNTVLPSAWVYDRCSITVFVDQVYPQPFGHRDIAQTYQSRLNQVMTVTPVQLVAFYTEEAGDGIRIAWRTASENNNSGWSVERRELDGEWQDVAFVEGRGTTMQAQAYEHLDMNVKPGTIYDYRLRQIDFDGRQQYSPVSRIAYHSKPVATRLHQNYPNPFNPSTDIMVDLASGYRIRLDVYDAMGRLVQTLADADYQAGFHSFTWNGSNAAGASLPAGLYYCRLTTSGSTETVQMHLVK
jgi:hypothetical protein